MNFDWKCGKLVLDTFAILLLPFESEVVDDDVFIAFTYTDIYCKKNSVEYVFFHRMKGAYFTYVLHMYWFIYLGVNRGREWSWIRSRWVESAWMYGFIHCVVESYARKKNHYCPWSGEDFKHILISLRIANFMTMSMIVVPNQN